MSSFFKNSVEILSQGAGHLWGSIFKRIRPMGGGKGRQDERTTEPDSDVAASRAPARWRKAVIAAGVFGLVLAGALLLRPSLVAGLQSPGDADGQTSRGLSWLDQYKQALISVRQGDGSEAVAALGAPVPANPVSGLLLERLRATAKFQNTLSVTHLPEKRLVMDWAGQDSTALEALAWSLREAIEQAMDAGQWDEAQSIATDIEQSGLLASEALSMATRAALHVASGRARLATAAEFREKNADQLVDWVASMQDRPLTAALLDAHSYLAELDIRAGSFHEARERLAALSNGVVADETEQDTALGASKVQALARFAGALLRVGAFKQARQALEPYTAVATEEKNCWPFMDAHLVAAEIAIEEAEFVRAESSFGVVQDCLRKLHGPGYFKEGRLQNGLGILYTQMGRLEPAAVALGSASKIWTSTLAPHHEWMGSLHNNLGALYRAQGQFEDARVEYDAAAEIWRSALGETHPGMATYFNNIAELGMLSKQLDEVKDALNSALKLRRLAFGDEHPWTALVLSNMGEYLALVGQPGAALNNHRIALGIREKSLGKNHADTAMSLNNLGAVLYGSQEYRQSLESFSRAVAINKTLFGDAHPQTLLTKLNLAINNMALGDYPAAEVWLKQIVDSLSTDSAPSVVQMTALAKLGDTQLALNNLAGAQTHFERVLASVEAPDRDSLNGPVSAAYKGLLRIYSIQGNAAAARALARKYPWAKS